MEGALFVLLHFLRPVINSGPRQRDVPRPTGREGRDEARRGFVGQKKYPPTSAGSLILQKIQQGPNLGKSLRLANRAGPAETSGPPVVFQPTGFKESKALLHFSNGLRPDPV